VGKATLDGFGDKLCLDPDTCFDFELIECADGGVDCTTAKLEPTGHSLLVAPKDKADWSGGVVAVALFHAGAVGQALTDAFLSDAAISGDADLFEARFVLTQDVDAAAPLEIAVTAAKVNDGSGLALDVTVASPDGTPTLMVNKPPITP